MKIGIKLFFILFLFPCLVFAQNEYLDSLLNHYKNEKSDSGKVNDLQNLFLEYEFTDKNKAKEFIYKALELSTKVNYKKGLATTYKYLGFFAEDTGNYQQAIAQYLQSLKISENINDKNGIAATLGNIGSVYYFQGNYPVALNYYLKALRIAEELKDSSRIAKQLANIGIVYNEQSDYPRALDYYYKALGIAQKLNDKNGIAADFGSIGNVYKEQATLAKSHFDTIGSDSLYRKALEFYFKALKLAEELNDKNKIATQYSNIGRVFHEQNDYQKALDYIYLALKVDKELGNKIGIATDLGLVGALLTSIKKYEEAESNLLQAIAIADSIGILKEKMQFENSLSTLYTQTGDFKKAFEHYKKYIEARDTLINQDKSREIMNYEFEKREAIAKAEQDKKDALAAAENRKQKIITWSVVSGLFLVILFTIFIFRSLRITKKQKNIIEQQKLEVDEANIELNKQNIEIIEQRNKIENQKKVIEEHQKEIVDSINYAQRIQQAKLPVLKELSNNLPLSFILFKPKDIVSGDFYFFHKSELSDKEDKNELVFIAAADCTGHGVPGAFMSLIGTERLEDAVAQKTNPSDILNLLNRGIKSSLRQTDSEDSTRDGMDIALCSINIKSRIINYAGANRPLWIIRKGQTDIEETKATKKAIGGLTDDCQVFDCHKKQLDPGDTFYLFSDGFADQFNPNGKKLMTRKFREILISIQDYSMDEQRNYLETFINNWKENTEQTDDILVIGVRV